MNYFQIVPADSPDDFRAAGYAQNLYPSVSIARRAMRHLARRVGDTVEGWEVVKVLPENAKRHPKFKALIKPMGVLIQEARERAEVSQSKLAAMLDIHQPNICAWESGVRDPTEASFYEVMERLGQHVVITSSPATAYKKTARVYL